METAPVLPRGLLHSNRSMASDGAKTYRSLSADEIAQAEEAWWSAGGPRELGRDIDPTLMTSLSEEQRIQLEKLEEEARETVARVEGRANLESEQRTSSLDNDEEILPSPSGKRKAKKKTNPSGS